MPLTWTNIVCELIINNLAVDIGNAWLATSVPVSAALLGSLYVNRSPDIVDFLKIQKYPQPLAPPRCQYLYMACNVGAAAPLGYASYLVYKIGGGFDYTDTTVALGLYASTLVAGLFAVPALRSKKLSLLTAQSVVLALLSAATTVAFYQVDKISGYWTIPFTLLTAYYASITGLVQSGFCGDKGATAE